MLAVLASDVGAVVSRDRVLTGRCLCLFLSPLGLYGGGPRYLLAHAESVSGIGFEDVPRPLLVRKGFPGREVRLRCTVRVGSPPLFQPQNPRALGVGHRG